MAGTKPGHDQVKGTTTSVSDLMLRSRAEHGVSKHGQERRGLWPSFETALRAPQDEVFGNDSQALRMTPRKRFHVGDDVIG
jgi:hypothetical protein